jgi:hypothetical protein
MVEMYKMYPTESFIKEVQRRAWQICSSAAVAGFIHFRKW